MDAQLPETEVLVNTERNDKTSEISESNSQGTAVFRDLTILGQTAHVGCEGTRGVVVFMISLRSVGDPLHAQNNGEVDVETDW